MIVSVTGGTGFIGAQVVRAHLSRGDEVRVLSRRPTGPFSGARMMHGDLARGEVPKAFATGADVLYHCAGELRNQSRMDAIHVGGTRALLKLASASVGRWVQLSSVGVYGSLHQGTVTEDTPEQPIGCYEVTKARSDVLVREAHAAGAIDAVILRPSIIFGPEMPNASLFQLIAAVERGLFFFIGPPGASANYIAAENVVDALVLCATSARASGEVFNLSTITLIEDFVGCIAAALGKLPPRLRLPRPPLCAAAAVLGVIPGWPLTRSRVDALTTRATYPSQRIESMLGYRPRITIQTAIEQTVTAWRAVKAAR